MSYRVIQWATGNTGQRALREVIRDPSLELVGVLVYDDAKNGVDAGRLCNEGDTLLLPDPYYLRVDGMELLLSHGDIWCTQDRAYQRFRRISRSNWGRISR